MKPAHILCMAFLAPLAACQGGGNGEAISNVTLSDGPAAGASSFMVAGDPAGSFGEAFVGADGQGVMLIEKDGSSAASAYYVVTKNTVRRVPAADSALQVSTVAGSAAPLGAKTIAPPDLAGHYYTLRDNAVVDFTISGSGLISAGASACGVNGAVQADSGITGALPLTMSFNGCGAADGSYQGYAVSTSDSGAGSIRIVAENRSRVEDMLAFR